MKRIFLARPALCRSLSAWAKANPRHAEIIKEYWRPHRRKRKLPIRFGGGEMPRVFLENLEYDVFDKSLLRIRHAEIRGADGLIFLPDGKVVLQTGWRHEHVVGSTSYRRHRSGQRIFKRGNYCTLMLYWGEGYYHWFTDVLATLHEALELMPKDTFFLLPAGFETRYGGDFYLKSLNALGIASERVIEFEGNESWVLENLWWQPPATNTDEQAPGALQWIGRSIAGSIEATPAEKPLKVYISRKPPSARVIANEELIVPRLREMGFRICLLEEMAFEEQLRIFRNAELVVGPHGAGFTNLIFSAPGTRVVEIFAAGMEKHFYWSVCEELGHDYHFLSGQAAYPGRRGEPDILIETRAFFRNFEK